MTKFWAVATSAGHLIPASLHDQQAFEKLKCGVAYQINATIPRNAKFLRKFFVLLGVAFDHWEPQPINEKYERYGTPEKDPERFREEILIMAGHCHAVFSIRHGELRYVAKSIAFGSPDCPDDTVFEGIYNRSVDVILKMILTNYTRDDLDAVVAELLSFT